MAHPALPAPRRRRVLGGLLDADGWAWAGVKAAFWFVVIILLLGYLPDRAYYSTVQKTVDVGLLAWAPVNFCPPENEGIPCPVPAGATLPWHPAPEEVRLPAGRTDGAGGVIGQTYIYAGGSDNDQAPSADVYISHAVGTGNIDAWSAGPALPEARSDAAYVVLGNSFYVVGGFGPDGAPTDTVYSLTVGNDGTLPDAWVEEEAVQLPEARAGASAVTRLGRDPAHGRHQRHGRDGHRLEEQAGDRRRPRRMGATVPAVRAQRRRRSRPTPAT